MPSAPSPPNRRKKDSAQPLLRLGFKPSLLAMNASALSITQSLSTKASYKKLSKMLTNLRPCFARRISKGKENAIMMRFMFKKADKNNSFLSAKCHLVTKIQFWVEALLTLDALDSFWWFVLASWNSCCPKSIEETTFCEVPLSGKTLGQEIVKISSNTVISHNY